MSELLTIPSLEAFIGTITTSWCNKVRYGWDLYDVFFLLNKTVNIIHFWDADHSFFGVGFKRILMWWTDFYNSCLINTIIMYLLFDLFIIEQVVQNKPFLFWNTLPLFIFYRPFIPNYGPVYHFVFHSFALQLSLYILLRISPPFTSVFHPFLLLSYILILLRTCRLISLIFSLLTRTSSQLLTHHHQFIF